jgi:hypothetical protein
MKNLLRIAFILSLFLVWHCNNAQKNNSENKTFVNQSNNPQRKIEVRIFRNDTIPGSNLTGFGYDIVIDDSPHPTIHQPHIPAVGGLKGFMTEGDARKVAEYISKKLAMTNTLPRITPEELDSLGIKY